MASRRIDDELLRATDPPTSREILQGARSQVTEMNAAWAGAELSPEAEVELAVGSDGGPLLRFTVRFDLDADIAAEDYPTAKVRARVDELRQRLIGSDADEIGWLVQAASRYTAEGTAEHR